MAGNDIEHLKQQQAKLQSVVLAQLTHRGASPASTPFSFRGTSLWR